MERLFEITAKIDKYKSGIPQNVTELEWVLYIAFDGGKGSVEKDTCKQAASELAAYEELKRAAEGVGPAIQAAIDAGSIDHLDCWDEVEELWTQPLVRFAAALERCQIGTDAEVK